MPSIIKLIVQLRVFIALEIQHQSGWNCNKLTRVSEPKGRRYIPTEKQLVDPFRRGVIIKGVGYRQTVVTYKETASNHVWVSGLLGDGFGATHGMERNNLAWVVTGIQVRVDEYPVCKPSHLGEVMEVDTCRGIRTLAMMNQQTRCLSKMPEAVRAEISPGFIEKKTFQEEIPEKISELNTNAKFTNSNLKATRISLACRKECGSSDVVQSLCEPVEESSEEGHQDSSKVDNGDSLASA
ncbi:hypothetical protein POTOM_049193 [Populus tomentosa]|uniref:Uncharacterized protein n=1 Tax=Populus tomentosa TaxID=118781 RepID=A0A8X8C8W9_POPTO|nr:hypothetical protein POTOM_049193 [Populus tomentosa]